MTFRTFLVCLAIFGTCCGIATAARPIIKDARSTGGHTRNKTNAADVMYLAEPGDVITFSVTAEAAETYEWQVNKRVQRGATGRTFRWRVPREKGIWEIHVVVSNGEGAAHHEWVISTLSAEEAPAFFEFFADGRYKNRSEMDPWGRKLPEWVLYHGSVNTSAGFARATKGWAHLCLYKPPPGGWVTAGTWLWSYRFPTGWADYGKASAVHYYFMHDAFGLYDQNDWYAKFWARVLARNTGKPVSYHIDKDTGTTVLKKGWYQARLIRMPEGDIYWWRDDQLLFRDRVPDRFLARRMRSLEFRLKAYDIVDADNFVIYRNRYLFPKREIYFGRYVTSHEGENTKPIYAKGIVIKGRGVTLMQIANALRNSALFRYDSIRKTALCQTNLCVEDGAELVIENETLVFSTDGGRRLEFTVGMGATLRIINSIVAGRPGYFVWNFAGTTRRFGRVYEIPWKRGAYAPGHIAYGGYQSVFIIDSKIDNSAYFVLDEPMEVVIKDSEFTNLHNIDWGKYNLTDSNDRPRRAWVQGEKAFGLMIKDIGHLWQFQIENVTFSGAERPAKIFYMVNTDWAARLNFVNVTFHNAVLQIKKSARYCARYDQGFPVRGHEYRSNLGLINCRWDALHILTDKAAAVPKYYLDVLVVDRNGQPAAGVTVTVTNDVDDNYPAENLLCETYYHAFPHPHQPHYHFPSALIFESGIPIKSTVTGRDGHTPLPSNRKGTIVLADFVLEKGSKREFSYTITVEKDGRQKVITGVNPGPHWYRPNPNEPTYTIIAVLDGKRVTEQELKARGLAGPTKELEGSMR